MENLRTELRELLARRSLADGPVQLASGGTSDFYFDCKRTTLTARGMYLCGKVLFPLVAMSDAPAAVAGVTLGGDPLVCAVALESLHQGAPLDAILVRKQSKSHGTGAWLEGADGIETGSEVVLLEDVVTTGGSSLRAVQRLREAGFRCRRVIALIDRQQGAVESMVEAEVSLEVLFNREDFGR